MEEQLKEEKDALQLELATEKGRHAEQIQALQNELQEKRRNLE